MYPGLNHQIAMKRHAASELARQALCPDLAARTAYEKGLESEKLALAADLLSEQLQGNEQVMQGLTQTIAYLQKSKHQSRHRSLAVTELENAWSRLRMENGDAVEVPKFEAVEEPKPINGKKTALKN